jgi:Transglycosylase SLT domain
MNNITNSLQIKTLGAVAKNASPQVLNAIHSASSKTGVDFSYLFKQAAVESSFDASAKNKTSSATGLYQFIDSTWLQMVDRYGDDFGIDTDGKSKREILAMRKDPEAASFMAAAFASENEKTLNDNWGGDVGETELYLAHFLGANGASSFLNAKDENPMRAAADLFPAAARSNRNVFYDQETGKPRSLEQVYQFFNNKFEGVEKTTAVASVQNNAQIAPVAKMDAQMVDELLNTEATYVSFDRKALSDSVVMQRAQAMREARTAQYQQTNSGYNQIAMGSTPTTVTTPRVAIKDNTSMPFLSRIAQPLELMMLTQSASDKQGRMG